MRDERLPRRFLNELDDMLKGNGEETGLGLDCISARAMLQLPAVSRERLVGGQHPQASRLGTVLLGPKPSQDHRTIGLTVAPLEVLSWVRWPQRKCGTCNTMATISVAAAAKHATGRLVPIRCWCQHQKGGREPPCCSIWPRSTKTWATTTSCRKDIRYVLIPHGVFWRSTWRVVGRSGRSYTGAVAPHRQPNFC